MLPTLALVQNEKVIGYIVGFDELGGTDDFRTEVLAARLSRDGMVFLQRENSEQIVGNPTGIRKSELTQHDEDSDFE